MKMILVVEDEMRIARLVRDYLEHAGFEVVVAGDGEAALASARGSRPDLVVLDLGLPQRDGLDVTRETASQSPCQPVLQGFHSCSVHPFILAAIPFSGKRPFDGFGTPTRGQRDLISQLGQSGLRA